MQQIYRRKSMLKCDFNKVASHKVHPNRTSVWVFFCKFAVFFRTPFLGNTSGWLLLNILLSNEQNHSYSLSQINQTLYFGWVAIPWHSPKTFQINILGGFPGIYILRTCVYIWDQGTSFLKAFIWSTQSYL